MMNPTPPPGLPLNEVREFKRITLRDISNSRNWGARVQGVRGLIRGGLESFPLSWRMQGVRGLIRGG